MTIQEIKKYFFTFRDGLTADVLKKGGVPHKMIFGLQIPQISAKARDLSALDPMERQALAEELWKDKDVRESRLLACYLFDPDQVSEEIALQLASEVRTQEEADMLAFRLLSRLPFKGSLAEKLPADSPSGKALARFI